MGAELDSLKTALRALVVSCPTQMDALTLGRDFRNMMGSQIPFQKFGYKNLIQFLKERCSDSFLFHGPANNPVLTLIVPDQLKHIDKFVKKQKISSTAKFKGKRFSVQAKEVHPKPITKQANHQNMAQYSKPALVDLNIDCDVGPNHNNIENGLAKLSFESNGNINQNGTHADNNMNACSSKEAVHNFLRQRLPPTVHQPQSEVVPEPRLQSSVSHDDQDSGRHTSSSGSFKSKQMLLQELKIHIRELLREHPDGIWTTDLLKMYRVKFDRELKFERLGFSSIISLLKMLQDVLELQRPEPLGDWLLIPAGARGPEVAVGGRGPGGGMRPPGEAPRASRRVLSNEQRGTSEEALPGIEFEPSVFPEDCLHFVDSIPPPPVPRAALLAAGGGGSDGCDVTDRSIEMCVAEIYSPSHFWLMVLGEQNMALHNCMDEMNEYYHRGDGRTRRLSVGALRVGHYCAALFEHDWHRAIIVKIVDADHVKVRYIDYGTVEQVSVSKLRPLLREYGRVPAQALRGRLAGVRPAGGGTHWARDVADTFLQMVTERALVGRVVAADLQENIMELFLVDTSTPIDVCINRELVKSGLADSRPDSTLHTSEWYLYPTFAALEEGATPTMSELSLYLRRGISLYYVEEYRRHVPGLLPPNLGRVPPATLASPASPASPAGPAGDSTDTDESLDAHMQAHTHAQAHTNTHTHSEGEVVCVPRLQCEVYRTLVTSQPHVSAAQLSRALRAAPPSPGCLPAPPGTLALPALDCEVFLQLLEVHEHMAHRQMCAVLDKLLGDTPPTPPTLPPPPGFENHRFF